MTVFQRCLCTMQQDDCVFQRCLCTMQQDDCVFQRCLCTMQQDDCVFQKCLCTMQQDDCVFLRCLCSMQQDDCVFQRCLCSTQQDDCVFQQDQSCRAPFSIARPDVSSTRRELHLLTSCLRAHAPLPVTFRLQTTSVPCAARCANQQNQTRDTRSPNWTTQACT